jgi:hypothetical protein
VGIQWRGPVPQSNTGGRDGSAVELIVDLTLVHAD